MLLFYCYLVCICSINKELVVKFWALERINPIPVISYGNNSFYLRRDLLTYQVLERINFVSRGTTVCLITFKALKFNQPSYIRELLSFSSNESTLGLRSADDPYRLHEPRAIGERGFADRSFSYTAPRFYNRLPVTIKQIDSLDTFKSHLKAFLFSRAYDLSCLTVHEDYAL